MTQWNLIPISELGQVYTGRTPPSSNPEYFGEQYPFITPSDMDSRRIISTTERYLSEAGAKLLQRIRLPAKSVCVSCIGWQMGKAVMTSRPSFTNQQINSIVPNERVMPEFLYYSLKPRKDELLSLGSAIGVRTPILNKTEFSSLKIAVPTIPLQRRIVAVLSAYDDLIENNTRRIAILEEMARRLYREWFVHFRFPGHEAVAMVEAEGRNEVNVNGRIPKGWQVVPLKTIVDLKSGFAFKSKNYDSNGRFGLVTIGNVQDGKFIPECSNRIQTPPALMKDYCYLKSGDILLSLTGNIGRACIVYGNDFLLNQRVAKLVPRQSLYWSFVYAAFRQDDTALRLEQLSTGVAQQNLSVVRTKNMQMMFPPKDLLEKFSNIVDPMLNQVLIFHHKNTNLRKTRDLLLPRLISGELDVASLDIAAAT